MLVSLTHLAGWRPTVSDKGHIIAFALALAPAAFIAWLSKAQTVFIAGAVGAIVGQSLAPFVTMDWAGDYNERDAILAMVAWDAPYVLVGAIVGSCLCRAIIRVETTDAARAK